MCPWLLAQQFFDNVLLHYENIGMVDNACAKNDCFIPFNMNNNCK